MNNSRFSALNTFEPEERRYNNRRNYSNQKCIDIIIAEEQFQKQVEERKRNEMLKAENFPQLVATVVTNNNVDISYIDKLNEQTVTEEVDQDLVKLKPGWTLFKRNADTREIIRKTHPKKEIDIKEKTDNEIALDVLNALVELHEKRTNDFIELNGYDTWEYMFKGNYEIDYDSEDEDDISDDESDISDYYDDDYYDDYDYYTKHDFY